MLCRVILGPRVFLLCTAQCSLYRVLRGVTASACDHGYRLIINLIMFLCLKIDYARIAQWEKN